ncbi:MAG TPA: phosphatase PAP2 family protein, partial [Chloroflexi bacterium]|nr:phosphatase PAP2 family protein [Chloroflexota bacterium]
FMGETEFYLLLIPFFYWLVNKSFGRRLTYLLLITGYLNTFAKNIFKLPRPPQVDPRVAPLVKQDGYGLPSGHSMSSMAVWGYAGWYWRKSKPWLIPLAIVFISSIAFSRLYLAVHFPADVITGLTFGLLILLLWIKLLPNIQRWIEQADDKLLLALSVLVPLTMLFLSPGDATGYPSEAIATTTGVLMGASIGFIFEARRVQFSVSGSWLQKLLRYVVGALFIGVFWFGLRVLFSFVPGGHLLEITLRFVRYLVSGLALGWWAPAVFVRFGLAKTVNSEE